MAIPRWTRSTLGALLASTFVLTGAAGAQAAITIDSPVGGAYINDLTPSVVFSDAVPGNPTVTLSLGLGGAGLGSDQADNAGAGSITASPALDATPASRSVELVVDDGTDWAASTVTVNQVPSLSGVLDGSLQHPGDVTFSASGAIPGEPVVLYDNGVEVDRDTADSNGYVSTLTPTSEPVNGAHSYQAATLDAAAVASSKTAAVNVTVSDVPTIAISAPVDDSYTNDPDLLPAVTYTGATPGGAVQVLFDGDIVGTVTSDGTGGGTLVDPNEVIAPTPTHNQDVTVLVRDGSAGFNQSSIKVNVDQVPSLSGPGAGFAHSAESIEYQVTGAIPSNDVILYSDGVEVARETADSDGEVASLKPDALLSPGTQTLTAVTVDDDAIRSSPESIVLTISPTAPQLQGLFNGAQLNQSPPAVAIMGVHPDATKVTLYEVVRVGEDDTFVNLGESLLSDSDGSETVALQTPLSAGEHILIARQTVNGTETDDYQAQNVRTTVVVDPSAPTLSSYYDGKLTTQVPSFQAHSPLTHVNSDSVNSVRFYVNGVAADSDTTSYEGYAYFDPETLADGAYSVYAVTVDDLGHESAARSNAVTFTLDTAAPATPTFTSPGNGAALTTNTPLVTVHAEPGTTVHLYGTGTDDDLSGTADANGDVTFTLTRALPEGKNGLGAQAVDGAGNYSDFADITFTVTTATPPTPVPPAPTPVPPVATPTPTPTPATPAAPTKVTVSSDTLTKANPIKLGFTLKKAATVKVTITKIVNGKTVTVATVTVQRKAGEGSYTLKTKVGGKTLKHGAYKVSLQTVNGNKKSKPVSAKVSVR